METNAESLRLISLMLSYPDSGFLSRLPELESALESLPSGRVRRGLQQFLAQVRLQTPIRLQACYTAAFDLNPSTTLNLTYHHWGDGEKRAAALTQLQQIYGDAGYEIASAELPDYLPLMLEFMAVCPVAGQHDLFRQCLQDLEALAHRLRKKAPLYADLLRLVADELGLRAAELPAPADETHPAVRESRVRSEP